MNQNGEQQAVDQDERPSRIPIVVTVLSLLALGITAGMWYSNPASKTCEIAFLMAQAVVISIVIWQACDPFADAAQWIGATLHIPGSVRGATLDAVASSMPELFTGIFFVVVAIASSSPENLQEEAADGFGAAIATCAGSAVYNMVLIPAFCAIVISYYRPDRPTIDVDREVVTRDGVWFLGTSVLLIIFLFAPVMYWWMGVLFLILYVIYVYQLFVHARTHRRAVRAIHAHFEREDVGDATKASDVISTLQKDGIEVTHEMVEKYRSSDEDDDDEDEEPESAGLLFGYVEVPLNHLTAWIIIVISTLFAASACYWLVIVTEETATALGVNIFFVAVILAAAASSVPDTFLSIGAAMRDDDSGAVSNAFGSNIFDICICLAIPLLVNSMLLGWAPVPLTVGGKAIAGLVDLRILLAVLTVVTLAIMWHQMQLTRLKAIVLCILYGIFISYAVGGSMGYSLSGWLFQG